MSKYGRPKCAFFDDGVVLVSDRSCRLKRAIRVRRQIEGYYGRVRFLRLDIDPPTISFVPPGVWKQSVFWRNEGC